MGTWRLALPTSLARSYGQGFRPGTDLWFLPSTYSRPMASEGRWSTQALRAAGLNEVYGPFGDWPGGTRLRADHYPELAGQRISRRVANNRSSPGGNVSLPHNADGQDSPESHGTQHRKCYAAASGLR